MDAEKSLIDLPFIGVIVGAFLVWLLFVTKYGEQRVSEAIQKLISYAWLISMTIVTGILLVLGIVAQVPTLILASGALVTLMVLSVFGARRVYNFFRRIR